MNIGVEGRSPFWTGLLRGRRLLHLVHPFLISRDVFLFNLEQLISAKKLESLYDGFQLSHEEKIWQLSRNPPPIWAVYYFSGYRLFLNAEIAEIKGDSANICSK